MSPQDVEIRPPPWVSPRLEGKGRPGPWVLPGSLLPLKRLPPGLSLRSMVPAGGSAAIAPLTSSGFVRQGPGPSYHNVKPNLALPRG